MRRPPSTGLRGTWLDSSSCVGQSNGNVEFLAKRTMDNQAFAMTFLERQLAAANAAVDEGVLAAAAANTTPDGKG